MRLVITQSREQTSRHQANLQKPTQITSILDLCWNSDTPPLQCFHNIPRCKLEMYAHIDLKANYSLTNPNFQGSPAMGIA
jgi:hypothetical protein